MERQTPAESAHGVEWRKDGNRGRSQEGRVIPVKLWACLLALFIASSIARAQSNQPTDVFPKSTMTMNVMPVTVTGGSGAATGSETDALVSALRPLSIGETTVVSNKFSFIGARADFTVRPLSAWIQNHSSANGYKFQIGPTVSVGAVKIGNQSRWGQRAGIFVNYSLGWAVGMQFEAQWNNLPGYAHNSMSISFGPNCHW